jgi:hypothetical protein
VSFLWVASEGAVFFKECFFIRIFFALPLFQSLSLSVQAFNLKGAVAGLTIAHLPKIIFAFQISVFTLTVTGSCRRQVLRSCVLLRTCAISIRLSRSFEV